MNIPFHKKTSLEILIIISISILVGISKNVMSQKSFTLFRKYNQTWLATTPSKTSNPFQVDAESVMHLFDNDLALIVDIRPYVEYKAGHIPSSINGNKNSVRLNSLNLNNLNKIIIIFSDQSSHGLISDYCRELSKKGVKNILVFKKGIKHWVKNGYPIEISNTEE
jgi:rhodanese-related sulfurtransferase